MKTMDKLLFTFCIFIISSSVLSGQVNYDSTKTSSGGFLSNLGFEIDARSHFNAWFSSEDRDDDEGAGEAIDYETEGVQTWKIAGDLKWNRINFIGGSFEQPFHDTPEQREIIEKTTETQTSLESYLFYLQLPFLQNLTDNAFVAFLSEWRFDYRRYLFHGKGISVEPAVFLDKDGNQTFLEIDDIFRFKSSFQDWDFTYPIFSNERGGTIRLGIYWSQINKPYETRFSIFKDDVEYAQVIEAKISGFGGVCDIETSFLRFILKAGSAEFSSIGKIEGRDPFTNTGSFDFLLYLRLWATIDVFDMSTSHKTHRLSIKPIVTGQFRADYLDTSSLTAGIIEDEFTMDIILDAGISISWLYY